MVDLSLSLKFIKYFFVFFYIIIEHSMGAIKPLLLCIGVGTDIFTDVPTHFHKRI